MDKFEEAYEKMKKDGKTNVNDVVSWMKDSKLIDNTKEAEDKAKKLFADMKEDQNIELDKFKEAIQKSASEQKKTLEEFTKTLVEQGPRLATALAAGASAFKDALSKK